MARYTGPIIVPPQFFGRRSAHFRMASSAGQSDCPHLVNRYSTFGGTWGYAVRCTMPSASMLFNCCPNILVSTWHSLLIAILISPFGEERKSHFNALSNDQSIHRKAGHDVHA